MGRQRGRHMPTEGNPPAAVARLGGFLLRALAVMYSEFCVLTTEFFLSLAVTAGQ
ncbi:hypothetical protein [Brasilonema sennae]|uniref:hypothetical protein n=1 Tax=Brasilonema sennae TaxID=1397703 RepID=UPI001C13060C|nr:hypothetical protein [Brasilonema sennae]